uniref:Uncharacterized protein n=1 Tax=Tetranychus urticae TaxID=32264 RepID=T1KW17_TETUR
MAFSNMLMKQLYQQSCVDVLTLILPYSSRVVIPLDLFFRSSRHCNMIRTSLAVKRDNLCLDFYHWKLMVSSLKFNHFSLNHINDQ